MDAAGTHLDPGRDWPDDEGGLWITIQPAVSGLILNNGVVGSNRGAPGIKSHAAVGSGLVDGRWHSVHRRRRFLCRSSSALRPLRLAPVCHCRNDLSLFRGALVLSLTTVQSLKKLRYE